MLIYRMRYPIVYTDWNITKFTRNSLIIWFVIYSISKTKRWFTKLSVRSLHFFFFDLITSSIKAFSLHCVKYQTKYQNNKMTITHWMSCPISKVNLRITTLTRNCISYCFSHFQLDWYEQWSKKLLIYSERFLFFQPT